MSVESILQAMAENAGNAAHYRGRIIADTVAGASQVPAQILADRAAAALLSRKQGRENEQLRFQRNADTRAMSDQSIQETAARTAIQHKATVDAGLKAAIGESGDPTKFNARAAFDEVSRLGDPSAIRDVIAAHRDMMPKLTSAAAGSSMRDESGRVVTGSTVPEKKPDYTVNGQRFSGETNQPFGPAVSPQVTPAPAQTHNMRLKGIGDKPVDYVPNKDGSGGKWMYLGKDVSGDVSVIPAASIQINQAAAATANNPASAAEKAIANYMLPPISPRSMQTPAGKAMMDRILTENPDYDASKFSVRAPVRKAFATGTQGQQITAMNTAIEHLDQLQAASDALKNGDFKPGNRAYNYLKETFGANAPTNYDTIKNMVDKEVEAVANKGVPTVSGTAEQKALAGKSASHTQIKGYIDTLIPLMGSKVNALHYQYKQSMGENDPWKPLTPEAEAILSKRAAQKTTTTTKPTAAELIKKYGG